MIKNKKICLSAACLTVMLGFAAGSCQQRKSEAPKQSVPPTQTTAATSKAKVRLNNEEIGTSDDLSALEKRLKEIFRQRGENGVLPADPKKSASEVFLRAEPSLKLKETAKVIKALENSEVFPVLLPIEGDLNKVPKPNPLSLVVSVGKSNNDESILDEGVSLNVEEIPYKRSELVKPWLMVVEIRKDGEYLIDNKPVAKADLKDIFKAFFKPSKTTDPDSIYVYLENNLDEISFGSIADLAQPAFQAGVQGILVKIYRPE